METYYRSMFLNLWQHYLPYSGVVDLALLELCRLGRTSGTQSMQSAQSTQSTQSAQFTQFLRSSRKNSLRLRIYSEHRIGE